jgi:ABC-type polysaccharide/polyol phosphate transport system ATPase subunit
MSEIHLSSHPGVVIHLEDISVCYKMPSEPIPSLKEYAIRYVQGKIKLRSFWALSNLNLDIHRGEILGVIGKNGAGKSTLLKVISRIIPINNGRLWIKGSVTPMMEVGAGFHPELTGRENIFLNGTLLGHANLEIRKKMNEILDFAEIDDFVDTPVRTYSSGMVARLGFAVATAWRPEILLLDEIFAVGDIFFREKCLSKIEEFHSAGSTLIIVSHDNKLIEEICSRAIWLEQGLIKMIGSAHEIVRQYNTHPQDTITN